MTVLIRIGWPVVVPRALPRCRHVVVYHRMRPTAHFIPGRQYSDRHRALCRCAWRSGLSLLENLS